MWYVCMKRNLVRLSTETMSNAVFTHLTTLDRLCSLEYQHSAWIGIAGKNTSLTPFNNIPSSGVETTFTPQGVSRSVPMTHFR